MSELPQTTSTFVTSSIAWYNINVRSIPQTGFFQQKKNSVHIIKNVSGHVPAGSTLAIMGSSGAGKTTLLNVLTARNLSNFAVEGCVKINGQTADVDMITSVSAYVQQQDLFLATLTVREHLVFQAMLRMNASISPREKADRIVEVMRELSLEKCADTIVGGTMSTGKGISGGELKRLAFAVEILTNPSIMFCDEPTSGLDAFMAANLVEYLNKMASKGRTIICTIHQPSTDVFNLFENLLLMADGQVAYMGNTQQALEYFKSCGLPCPLNYNPADFYVQELAVIPGKEEACHEKIDKICSYHRKLHPMSGEAQQQQTTFVQKTVTTSYKVSCLTQYKALAWRSSLITQREPLLTTVRLGQGIIVATILGIFFWGQELNERGVMNINGALFIYLLNLSMQNAFAVVNVFCSELPVFLREYGSGMYRPDSYYVTKNLAEMPIFVLLPIFVGCINYYMIGFNKDVDAFLYLIVVGIVISSIGVSYGYFISCLCNNTDLALSAGPPIIIPLQLLGGFYLNSKTMPSFLSWAQNLSWFYYGFDLLMRNQWSEIKHLNCSSKVPLMTTTTVPTTLATTLETTSLAASATTAKPHGPSMGICLPDGKGVIEFLDMGNHSEVSNFVALIIIFLVLRTGGYVSLYVRAKFSR